MLHIQQLPQKGAVVGGTWNGIMGVILSCVSSHICIHYDCQCIFVQICEKWVEKKTCF